MKKNNKQKKLLIPLITAACIMYGCSSQPASSTKTESPAEATAETETTATQKETEDTAKTDSDKESSKTAEDTENTNTAGDEEGESTEDSTETKESGDESAGDEESEESSLSDEDTHIQTVKNAQPDSFPGCSYGSAFEEFFSSPEWEYFESTDGRDVVEFTGECIYAGARTKARMQFIVSGDNSTIATGALYYNNTPQSTKIITESLNKIFEQYAKAHGIAYTLPTPSAAETTQTTALPPDTQTNAQTEDTQTGSLSESVSSEQPSGPQANTSVNSGGAQAALSFAAWTNPNIGSWYSPSTGYYVIPFVDNAGNASISFAKDNTRAAYAAVYYTDAVSAVTNEAGGLTYQGYIYTASSEEPKLIGMVEVSWNSVAELNTLSVKMINGNQTMDNSMSGSDYAYYGTVN